MQTKTISSPADARDERPNRFVSAAFCRWNYQRTPRLEMSRSHNFTVEYFAEIPIASTKTIIDNILNEKCNILCTCARVTDYGKIQAIWR